MEDHTYQNWIKVKEALEKSGKINTHIYRRACEMVKSQPRITKSGPS